MELQPPQLAVFAQHALHIRGLRELVQRVCLSLLRRLRRLLSATRREVRLQSCTHHAEEPTASKVNTLGLLVCDRLDWQHNIPLKDLADRHACVACHGCVDRVVRQDGAIHAVICVWSHRANHVGRVDILDCKRQLHLLEPIQDLVSQPRADICELHITACIDFAGAAKHRVPAALGDDDHAVALCLHQADAVLEDLVGRDIHLRQEADVHIPGRQACIHGDKAAMPPHELHQANAISIASRLGVSGLHSLQCLGTRRVEAEGPVEHGDVVVDGLRDADDGALPAELLHCLVSVVGATVRTVAADDKVLPDSLRLEDGRLHVHWRVAPIACQHGAAQVMDVAHRRGRQLHPTLRVDDAFVASSNPINLLNTVDGQHLDNLAYDGVETGAQAAASDDGGHHIAGIEVQRLSGACRQHLVVRLRVRLVEEHFRDPRVWSPEAAGYAMQRRLDLLRRKVLLQHLDSQAPKIATLGDDVRCPQRSRRGHLAGRALHREGGAGKVLGSRGERLRYSVGLEQLHRWVRAPAGGGQRARDLHDILRRSEVLFHIAVRIVRPLH
mmetsp:Transcript_105212/g.304337  ORF Transcript_105212/g.304337 Transcript_105212/m.304337 type:complete len:556 (-) Transcript_105212:521-2188(-)